MNVEQFNLDQYKALVNLKEYSEEQYRKACEVLQAENNGLRERIKFLDEQIVGYRAANAKLTSKVEQGDC